MEPLIQLATGVPAIGICGWSGSGKTTLILALTAHFLAKGLRVGVIKHDVHGLQLDREGKDSYRFFESGADVIMRSSSELLVRAHRVGDMELSAVLREVAPFYDLILVEGHKATPLIAKLWVLGENEAECPHDVPNVMHSLPRGDGRVAKAIELIEPWLATCWQRAPVWAAVLLDGDYRGSVVERRKDLALLAANLGSDVADVVAVGNADFGLPLVFAGAISPAHDVSGWRADVLAAMRWLPSVSWLFVAEHDHGVAMDKAKKLLQYRALGVWVIASSDAFQAGQAIQALYCDCRARPLIEGQEALDEIGRWPVTKRMYDHDGIS